MLELKKRRRGITPVKFGIAVVFIIIFWLLLQFTIQSLMDTVYFRFLLLCFLGFGFLAISYMLRFA